MDHDFTLSFWTDATSEAELRSEFRRKWTWVVAGRATRSRRYSTVLGNLTRRYATDDAASVDSVRQAIVKGFEKNAFDRLKTVIRVSGDELAGVIRIPPRTLGRRTTFKPDESERILRVATAFQRTIEVFEDLDRARRWFSSPQRALGGRTPFEFCDTEPGADEVMDLLGRLEHGVFT